MHPFRDRPSARRIPVRVVNTNPKQNEDYLEPKLEPRADASNKETSVDREQISDRVDPVADRQPATVETRDKAPAQSQPQPERPPQVDESMPAETEGVDWKTIAKRQQAEMENFRKRQSRRMDEAVMAERERLLRLMLPVTDNLARALSQEVQDVLSMRQGVELTHRELNRTLASEGVTKLDTIGQPFDPNWHDALATIPGQAEPNTIIEEIEPGYRLGDKLLRPAKVIVAA